MWVRFCVAPKQRAAAAFGSFGKDLHSFCSFLLLTRNKPKILRSSSLLALDSKVVFV
ncbi:unnamed protein product [Sphenostylis stenocarpa]|uniref:Uncharacterized protein n=1 Tax=Sphenostylis stenocarpa TaxID=92480 RepID=A0AA86S6H7_9FABA|nr:unnamed protein product [Sphenostylis stenocarpa]